MAYKGLYHKYIISSVRITSWKPSKTFVSTVPGCIGWCKKVLFERKKWWLLPTLKCKEPFFCEFESLLTISISPVFSLLQELFNLMNFLLLSIFLRNFLHSTEKKNFVTSFKSLQEHKTLNSIFTNISIFKMSLSFHIISKYIVLSLFKVESVLKKNTIVLYYKPFL